MEESTPRQNDTVAEKNISGGELLTAIFLSIPLLSHTGTSTIAPPNPSAPPTVPAKNPYIIHEFILASVILSELFEYTYPRLSFSACNLYWRMAMDLV